MVVRETRAGIQIVLTVTEAAIVQSAICHARPDGTVRVILSGQPVEIVVVGRADRSGAGISHTPIEAK